VRGESDGIEERVFKGFLDEQCPGIVYYTIFYSCTTHGTGIHHPCQQVMWAQAHYSFVT
jgi:hypothetical protein